MEVFCSISIDRSRKASSREEVYTYTYTHTHTRRRKMDDRLHRFISYRWNASRQREKGKKRMEAKMLTVSQLRQRVSFVNVPWKSLWTKVGSGPVRLGGFDGVSREARESETE
jgi:hypothetical protein